MKLSDAREMARKTARETGKAVLIYRDTMKDPEKDYDVAYSIPSFGAQEGDPFEPPRKHIVEDQATPVLMGSSRGGATGELQAHSEPGE